MAFSNKSVGLGAGAGGGASATPLDQSQIQKVKDLGYNTTPISKDPAILNTTTPTTKQILPGSTIGGFQDGGGNFYVVDDQNTVIRIDDGGVRPPTMGPPFYSPPTIPPTLPPNPPPVQPPPPFPSSNFGSGKIYTMFEVGDIVPNQQEVITRAMWSGNVGNLVRFFTSSIQTATQKRYYYEVFNSASGDCGSEAQFSVAYGHKMGSGSADEGGQINDTPSRAIYGQYRLLCLDGDTPYFTIAGRSAQHIYVVNINRARMREYVDEGNIELNLAHLSGSQWVKGGRIANAYTGSNVKVGGLGKVLRLTDDSTINSATITEAGEVYQMVSGSLEVGVYNPSAPKVFGLMYKRLGIVVLDARLLNESASFGTVTGSEISGDNAMKLFKSISGSARYTDPSGDKMGFQARSAERVKSTHYFCRIKNPDYNFSNNPTYVTGSEGDLSEPTFINDPIVYITTVGLYNERKECIAVAKVSKAIKKSFTSEGLIQVKLEF